MGENSVLPAKKCKLFKEEKMTSIRNAAGKVGKMRTEK